MPELVFVSRWPDGSRLSSYSPSLVVHDHLRTSAGYEVADFVARSRAALQAASERVRVQRGYPCGRAESALSAIEAMAAEQPQGRVRIESMVPERGRP